MIWMFLTSRLGKLLSGAIALLAAIGAVFAAGKRDEKKKQEIKDLKEYKETKEKIDETPVTRTRDAAIDRLRNHDQLR
jgi:hypothetical protein